MRVFWMTGLAAVLSATLVAGADHLVFEGGEGPGAGRHVVLLAGDEEYRSEEAMPLLAAILSERHGFKTTVCFSLNAGGIVDPKAGGSLSHPQALDSADTIVMLLRFRHWDDATMERFQAALARGVPVVALRTSTHAFNFPKGGKWADWSWNHADGGWGKKYLGETWVSHWGKHKVEGTLGVVEPGAEAHPILRGVGRVFGDSDVYEAAPPDDATILMRGKVLAGMDPEGPAADQRKKTRGGVEQALNDPMMPIAWTREVSGWGEGRNRVFCTTVGAATDLKSEGLRRMVVNAVFWSLGLNVPDQADVTPVGGYQPTAYGFDGFQTGKRPEDFRPAAGK
jgi:hypothetical protein